LLSNQNDEAFSEQSQLQHLLRPAHPLIQVTTRKLHVGTIERYECEVSKKKKNLCRRLQEVGPYCRLQLFINNAATGIPHQAHLI
jgi:hypothetical protein